MLGDLLFDQPQFVVDSLLHPVFELAVISEFGYEFTVANRSISVGIESVHQLNDVMITDSNA